LDRRAPWIDRSGRVRLRVTGPDRVKFLHNLTTNDVKKLGVGNGCEAFVTSPQGKTLGFVTLHAEKDSILLRADEGALEYLRPHFEKYAIFDEVTLDDLGPTTFERHVLIEPGVERIFLGSPGVGNLLLSVSKRELPENIKHDILSSPRSRHWPGVSGLELPEPSELAARATTIGGRPVGLIRESPTGRPGLTLVGAREDEEAILNGFVAACQWLSLTELVPAEFDAMRIEAGTPVFGRDITTANLPQEADRDARAISFTKGCYLGQETVARLDAMGHVNKILRGLLIDDEPRAEPAGDLPVVEPTSVAYSHRWGKRVGLAMVKVKAAAHRTRVEAAFGGERFGAVVQELPMMPDSGVNRIADFADEK
jgi:folate-binding protein YgfZ